MIDKKAGGLQDPLVTAEQDLATLTQVRSGLSGPIRVFTSFSGPRQNPMRSTHTLSPAEPPVDANLRPEDAPLPPGRSGLPLIGETFAFIRDPRNFFARRRNAHGDVFRSHVFGSPAVYMFGPEANQWIFAGEGKYLENRWTYGVRRLLGQKSVSMLTGTEHLERRRLLAPHFSYAAMRGFVPSIEAVARRHFQSWPSKGNFILWDAVRSLAFELALSLVFGDGAVNVPFLLKHFERWVAGLFSPVPLNIPLTTYGRALASRKALIGYLGGVVAERMQRASRSEDVLDSLINSRDDEGRPLSRDAIVDEVMVLLFAGHDTTVTATSNLMLQLAQHPEVLAKGRAALDASPGGPLSLDGLKAIPFLYEAINEGMRIIPPVGGAFRVMTQDRVFQNFRIPKGWTVALSCAATHLSELWTEPLKFDPQRFEEKPKPGTFIPFGGGPRICVGQHFAMVEMSVMLALLLREYRWDVLPNQDLTYAALPFPRPRSGIVVRFGPR